MQLSKNASLYLLASLAVSFLAGSSSPSPLYGLYQQAWGFSPITTTVVFGIYAIAVLGALLTVGSLSDYVGRKPVLVIATLAQALTMLLFSSASGVGSLITARIVQGLATGSAVGAIGAAMLDIDRERGTFANAVSPLSGTALGGILAGLVAQYLPAPTHLVYWILCAVFLAQAAALLAMPETSSTKPGALASLKPHFLVPPAVRQTMLFAVPVLIASWALAGFYASLGPTVVRKLADSNSLTLGGLVILVIAGSGALAVSVMHTRAAREIMTLGSLSLAVGVTITTIAISSGSVVLFFVGAAIAGVGFGAGLQGAIRSVVPLAAAHERAGVLSTIYVVAYLAMGVPAVFGGMGVVYGDGLFATAREYGLAVIALAVFALAGTLWKPAPARTSQVVSWAPETEGLRDSRA
ncbi:MAG TPA: MFS transporter [Polyangiales bacterium]|nr:MFS transporter [Polyangiales bacterium]